MTAGKEKLNLEKTALLLCDLQNDFLHPDGAYGRNGMSKPEISALPDRLKPVADKIKSNNGWVISTHFTLVEGKNGTPFISEHLRELRPFLGEGDFKSGSWGHDIIDTLSPVDIKIEKIAFSAFYMSRLDWVLKKIDVDNLVFAGIVTNGGVASTLRDAHVRDYHSFLLSDGCAAFNLDTHETAVAALAPVAEICTCSKILERLV